MQASPTITTITTQHLLVSPSLSFDNTKLYDLCSATETYESAPIVAGFVAEPSSAARMARSLFPLSVGALGNCLKPVGSYCSAPDSVEFGDIKRHFSTGVQCRLCYEPFTPMFAAIHGNLLQKKKLGWSNGNLRRFGLATSYPWI